MEFEIKFINDKASIKIKGKFLKDAIEKAIKNSINLSCANLTRANLTRAYLAGANLTGADLTGADLAGADLAGANLTEAYLTRADLAGADLTEAYLTEADLTEADLTEANLTRAYLAGANLTGADLTGADLTEADLTEADLTGADLTGAYLAGAYLTGAYLTGAHLTRANLAGAHLTRANLTGAYLTGAYLTRAECLVKIMGVEPGNVYWKRFDNGLINNGFQFYVGLNTLREGEVFASDERMLCSYPGFYFASRSWCAVNYSDRPLEARIRIPTTEECPQIQINEPWATDGKASANAIIILQVFDVKTGQDVTEQYRREK